MTFTSEDPNTIPATPEKTYGEMKFDYIRFTDGGLMVTLVRVDSNGDVDPTDEGLTIRYRHFDDDLSRAANLADAWETMLQGLGALYRERRLVEKIAKRSALGLDTDALEARLANVRSQLGIE